MIDEAMGLASMNPMVGTTPNNSVMIKTYPMDGIVMD